MPCAVDREDSVRVDDRSMSRSISRLVYRYGTTLESYCQLGVAAAQYFTAVDAFSRGSQCIGLPTEIDDRGNPLINGLADLAIKSF